MKFFCLAGPGVGRAGRGLAQLGLVREARQGQGQAWFCLGWGRLGFGLVSAGAGRAAPIGLVSVGAGREGLVLAWFQLGQVGQLGLAWWGQGQAGQLGFGSFWVSGAGRAGSFSWFWFGWGRAGLAWLGQVGQGLGLAGPGEQLGSLFSACMRIGSRPLGMT
ncbi:hypothetical protein BY996DRAFT_6504761 [Phakopsora pachyrhizi]|nr:hypothetical protein BY996DRAFT_6504761 [Phakopsora pachyrhizi]